jgi:hypothetical protein
MMHYVASLLMSTKQHCWPCHRRQRRSDAQHSDSVISPPSTEATIDRGRQEQDLGRKIQWLDQRRCFVQGRCSATKSWLRQLDTREAVVLTSATTVRLWPFFSQCRAQEICAHTSRPVRDAMRAKLVQRWSKKQLFSSVAALLLLIVLCGR